MNCMHPYLGLLQKNTNEEWSKLKRHRTTSLEPENQMGVLFIIKNTTNINLLPINYKTIQSRRGKKMLISFI